jgi:hypothetical protein
MNQTVEDLKLRMREATEANLFQHFLAGILASAHQEAARLNIRHEQLIAYGLAHAACMLADKHGDRTPVMAALHERWPEYCREVTEKEFNAMLKPGAPPMRRPDAT